MRESSCLTGAYLLIKPKGVPTLKKRENHNGDALPVKEQNEQRRRLFLFRSLVIQKNT